MADPAPTAKEEPTDVFTARLETRRGVIAHMLPGNGEPTWVVQVEPLSRPDKNGGTRTRLGFPVAVITGWIADPDQFAAQLAKLLTEDAALGRRTAEAQVGGWRTTESAPDGEVVDLWCDGKRLIGYQRNSRGWFKEHGYPVMTNWLTAEPQFWMPVPSAPSTDSAEPSAQKGHPS